MYPPAPVKPCARPVKYEFWGNLSNGTAFGDSELGWVHLGNDPPSPQVASALVGVLSEPEDLGRPSARPEQARRSASEEAGCVDRGTRCQTGR